MYYKKERKKYKKTDRNTNWDKAKLEIQMSKEASFKEEEIKKYEVRQ